MVEGRGVASSKMLNWSNRAENSYGDLSSIVWTGRHQTFFNDPANLN